jgi:hypothetical protein
VGSLSSHNLIGLHGLLQGQFVLITEFLAVVHHPECKVTRKDDVSFHLQETREGERMIMVIFPRDPTYIHIQFPKRCFIVFRILNDEQRPGGTQ